MWERTRGCGCKGFRDEGELENKECEVDWK